MATDQNGRLISKGARAKLRLASGAVAQGEVIIVSQRQTTIRGRVIDPEQQHDSRETLFGCHHRDVTIIS
ncbi:MAG: hypothetical protein COY66_01190 [Candidatus Kerfeldbacteria bacterium CG_4_10_14_0_8_um_filter_42_10]|uniref:Uncharacterized protein n=1 Tax=Candidatus Kerfeldbacteria bacterium CG_4_10_14_0_8_um_filter_42_10 TaxID=2014248 RepID=A0A2M7RK40_9BACT|nr:MAG: hypothetical protein COY66_01190 [Candidatus Kerfeldbacteria bacterium CG_4_10_14_0_8_um_filter_42_10]